MKQPTTYEELLKLVIRDDFKEFCSPILTYIKNAQLDYENGCVGKLLIHLKGSAWKEQIMYYKDE